MKTGDVISWVLFIQSMSPGTSAFSIIIAFCFGKNNNNANQAGVKDVVLFFFYHLRGAYTQKRKKPAKTRYE